MHLFSKDSLKINDNFDNLMVKWNSLESLITFSVTSVQVFESLRKGLFCLLFFKVNSSESWENRCPWLFLYTTQGLLHHILSKPKGCWILFNSSWNLLELELSVGVFRKDFYVTAHAFWQQLIFKILEEARV